MELVRESAVVGKFYPSDPKKLSKAVNQYLENATLSGLSSPIRAIIVPHAGFIYSGKVAAYAFKELKKARSIQNIKKVILLGPAHYKFVSAAVSDMHQWWKTPLGKLRLFNEGFSVDGEAHAPEHCLEVELPFLQTVLGDFEILPLLISDIPYPEPMADKINDSMDQHTLLLISTDLSHFLPYSAAVEIDQNTIDAILQQDLIRFRKQGDACGKSAVLTAMILAKKNNWKVRHLFYQNSGDVSHDHTSVVGYSSFIFY